MAKKEHNDRINYLRQKVKNFLISLLTDIQKIQDEVTEVRSRPDIDSKYELRREREPNSYMKTKPRDFDEELTLKRQYDPKRYDTGLQECTFKPDISHKGDQNRGIQDLYEWDLSRQAKLEVQKYSNLMNQPAYDFKPKISSKSIKLAEKNRNDGPLHDRLIKQAQEKEKKIQKMRKEEQDQMFKPTINNKSRQISSNIHKEPLKKVENGQSFNIEFFKAVPKFEPKLSPRGKSKSVKSSSNIRSKSKSCSKSQSRIDTIMSKYETCGKLSKGKDVYLKEDMKHSQKKLMSHTEYASPYNKGILNAGIPIKTLIEKSEKHRNDLKRKARKLFEANPNNLSNMAKDQSSHKKTSETVKSNKSRSPNVTKFDSGVKDKPRDKSFDVYKDDKKIVSKYKDKTIKSNIAADTKIVLDNKSFKEQGKFIASLRNVDKVSGKKTMVF